MYLKMTIHSEYWDGVYIWDLPFWNEPISKNAVTRVTSVFCSGALLGSDELFISGESLGVKLPLNCSTPISYLKKLFDDKTLWTSLQLKYWYVLIFLFYYMLTILSDPNIFIWYIWYVTISAPRKTRTDLFCKAAVVNIAHHRPLLLIMKRIGT